VTAANEKVTSDPSVVNTDAEKDGWLFKIKIQDAKDLGKYHVYI
jgi:glycine cleavage system H lipoate-binding protein